MKELVDTPIKVSEVQPGMVETDFSVTRYRGDKAAADKVYSGVQPRARLFSSLSCTSLAR
jgi:3-hydroxy acid dehydrogenase/malonic semialdehyde reductase